MKILWRVADWVVDLEWVRRNRRGHRLGLLLAVSDVVRRVA